MSQGLQVFDADGNLILDIGNRVIKILTETTVISGTSTNVPITKSSGTQLSVSTLPSTSSSGLGNLQPNLAVSSNNIAVTWPAGTITGRAVNMLVMEF